MSPAIPAIPETTWPTTIDDRDKNTGDDWVPRLQSMVRLTGKHPFNSEAPTKQLFDAGFVTPAPMHYVRNHGPVPKLSWDAHRVCVSGLGIESEASLSMADITAMPKRTIPITLVCAGNRRREMNLTKQSKGFNWGPGAVSTSVWGGVPLHKLLTHVGFKRETVSPHAWVTFDGPEGELPKGVYGTSVPVWKAMDPASDVMVAYEQNGERLAPDHGFPVRIIIPGYIGGRMIKWLCKITVTTECSDSWYHYHDNRVLPPMIDPERADKEDWWRKPEYIINDLNVNSAIVHPTQDELLPIAGPNAASIYTLRGYAYSGSGKRVTRVELSFDDGKTWEVVELSKEEYPTEYGKYWNWRHWQYEVDLVRLMGCKVVCLRAWDDAQNTQPRDLTWNVLGMMNNCWYRILPVITRDSAGQTVLKCDHPAMVGPSGGWMEPDYDPQATKGKAKAPVKPLGGGAEQVRVPVVEDPSMPRYSLAEIAKHNKKDDCWIVVNNKVYEVTKYMGEHPGGVTAIMTSAGQDATEDFEAIHSQKAHVLLKRFQIGVVCDTVPPELTVVTDPRSPVGGGPGVVSPESFSDDEDSQLPALRNQKGGVQCRLVEKVYQSADLLRARFATPNPTQRVGLSVGHHIALKARINAKVVKRSYTPITEPEEIGGFTLLLRVYRAGQHPKFPDGGAMSQHVDAMEVGSMIDVEGPTGAIIYGGRGKMTYLGEPMKVKHFAMVAGGTGITPMWQVLRAVLKDPEDTTEVSLLYASRSPDDLLLRAEMDELAEKHKNFRVWYTVDTFDNEEQKSTWKYDTGFVTEDMLRRALPPASMDVCVLMCGPPPMLNYAVKPTLGKLGFDENQMLSF